MNNIGCTYMDLGRFGVALDCFKTLLLNSVTVP
jgi:hypothetical protein